MAAWPNNPYAAWYATPTVPFTPPAIYYPPAQPYVGWGQPGASPNSYYANLPPTHATDPYRSHKYPTLNPTLAVDSTPVRYDVIFKPSDSISSHNYNAQRHVQATATPVSHMRLWSKSFPWTVEIVTPQGTMITCDVVWSSIHQALSQPIVDSEWGMLVDNKKHRDAVKKAAKERRETDKDAWLKRIDWLSNSTIFKGLEKDEEFMKHRLLPGIEECPETWMMKFSN